MTLEEVSEQKRSRIGGENEKEKQTNTKNKWWGGKKRKKKSNASIDVMKWSQSLKKRRGVNILSLSDGKRESVARKHWEIIFWKTMSNDKTFAYNDTGMTKDGRWDKQVKKKKKRKCIFL